MNEVPMRYSKYVLHVLDLINWLTSKVRRISRLLGVVDIVEPRGLWRLLLALEAQSGKVQRRSRRDVCTTPAVSRTDVFATDMVVNTVTVVRGSR